MPDFPYEALTIILFAEAAAAFDELTRSNRDDLLARQVKDAWPNVFRAARLIPAVEYVQANRLRTLAMLRWGDPEHHGYGAYPFGGIVEAERTFDGFTIPSKLRIGWYFGTDRWESEGEFFRCELDDATYR